MTSSIDAFALKTSLYWISILTEYKYSKYEFKTINGRTKLSFHLNSFSFVQLFVSFRTLNSNLLYSCCECWFKSEMSIYLHKMFESSGFISLCVWSFIFIPWRIKWIQQKIFVWILNQTIAIKAKLMTHPWGSQMANNNYYYLLLHESSTGYWILNCLRFVWFIFVVFFDLQFKIIWISAMSFE